MRFLGSIIVVFVLTATLLSPDARCQAALENVGVFAQVHGLNTVPDHGNTAVSFLDYRNAGYSIIAVDVPPGSVHEIARIFYAEPGVTTYSHRVAWVGYTPMGVPNVYVHDRSTGQTRQITTDSAFQNHPDLSADVLVWQDYRDGGDDGTSADIYMHDFATDVTSAVTSNAGYQDLPRIHGYWIIWQDYRHSDSLDTAEIYAFDLRTSETRRLTSGTAYRTHPSVWGDLVVWEDYRNGDRGDIYLYDLASDQEIAISTNPAHQSHPAVFGEWILWLDYRNSPYLGDIYGYHLGTREEYPLVVQPEHQEAPRVYNNHVVWQDYRDGRFDIFGGTLVNPLDTGLSDGHVLERRILSVAPNPSTEWVTFTLDSAHVETVTLTIYDIAGRVISRRAIPSFSPQAEWDGQADSGAIVPPGVYLAEIRGHDFVDRTIFVRKR